MADIQTSDDAEARMIRESHGIFTRPDERSAAEKLAESEAIEQSFLRRTPSDDAEAQALEESFGGGVSPPEIDPSEAAAIDQSFELGRRGT